MDLKSENDYTTVWVKSKTTPLLIDPDWKIWVFQLNFTIFLRWYLLKQRSSYLIQSFPPTTSSMKNIISYSSPPPISWEFLCWWLFILVQKRCSDKMARYGFFSPLLESRFDYQVFLTNEAYKLTTLKWENSHSSSTCLSSKLYLFCILFEAELWCGSLGSRRIKEISMDKGKGISDPFSMELPGKISKEKLKLGPSSGYGKEKATNDQHLPNLKSLVSDSTKKHKMKKGNSYNPKFDLTAMFEKLAAVRENEKRKKELTLIGFLVGEQKDLPRLYAKLRMEWKPLKGSLIFSTLKRGWFEMTFSNADDVNRVWMNRPYHMFSQLLLLKHWYPGFDPTTKSISQLDLWVRLHYLPEEFANWDALETIIEGNLIGSFLKMDPTHNSERWNMLLDSVLIQTLKKL